MTDETTREQQLPFAGQRSIRSVVGARIRRPSWMDSVRESGPSVASQQEWDSLRAAAPSLPGRVTGRATDGRGALSSSEPGAPSRRPPAKVPPLSLTERHSKRWWNRLATDAPGGKAGSLTARDGAATDRRRGRHYTDPRRVNEAKTWCQPLIERIESRVAAPHPRYAHETPLQTGQYVRTKRSSYLSSARKSRQSGAETERSSHGNNSGRSRAFSAPYLNGSTQRMAQPRGNGETDTMTQRRPAAASSAGATHRHTSKEIKAMAEKAFSTLHLDTLQTVPRYRHRPNQEPSQQVRGNSSQPNHAVSPSTLLSPTSQPAVPPHTLKSTSPRRRWGRDNRVISSEIVDQGMKDRVLAGVFTHNTSGSDDGPAGTSDWIQTNVSGVRGSSGSRRYSAEVQAQERTHPVEVAGWLGDRVIRWHRDKRYFSDLYKAEQRRLRGERQSELPQKRPLLSEKERDALEMEETKKRIFKLPEYSMDPVSAAHGFLAQTDIRALEKETNYSRRELFIMYVRFKALCAMSSTPQGITKEVFKRGVARLSVEDKLFVDRVFNIVDDDGSGIIEWEEFLTAMSALEKGSRDIKIQFCFEAYDLDQDTFIGREDLSKMFVSSSMLHDDDVTKEVVETFVRRVFQTLGVGPNEKGISEQHVHRFFEARDRAREELIKRGQYPEEDTMDVWDLFGRSMLSDFSKKSA